MSPPDPRLQLAQRIGEFRLSPLDYARFAFPWGSEKLPDAGPRTWQAETFQQIGEHLSNPVTRFDPLRIGIASGHGIGKSAGISMITKWGLDTCIDTRIVITANTETQLLTKTSPEIGKWARMAITRDWFKPNATSLVSTMPGSQSSWRADLVTWSATNTEAFAGLHNQGKRLIVIFDEASGIIPKVWEVTLGALTDAGTEIIWLAFGNPTQNTGDFRECFGKNRNLWKTQQIDSRTVEGTNKKYLDELVSTYGIDSDIVKVRVLGQFPNASSMQFIGQDLVDNAAARGHVEALRTDPVIFGLDCARFGGDDSVLAIRQGRDATSRPWRNWSQIDAMTLASEVVTEARRWHPDAIFVDAGNIGAAVVDRIRQLAPDLLVIEVWFGGKGGDAEIEPDVTMRTANKRSFIWTTMRAWLRRGSIPKQQRLQDDLVGPQYGYNSDQAILLERKEDMKKRGLPSPDWADALACTFAEPVEPRAMIAARDQHRHDAQRPRSGLRTDYDPYA